MGPRKLWLFVYLTAVGLAYFPLTRIVEPGLRELWFEHVTRRQVVDARGLEPPPGEMWLGANRPELPQSLHGIYELESRLDAKLGIASFYTTWGDGPEHAFPQDVMASLRDGGYLPLLTWEPWLAGFDAHRGQLVRGSLDEIARGSFEGYVRRFARDAAGFKTPFLIRPGHEATNPHYEWAPQYDNRASDYRAFFAYVRGIFREEGARNALFVWTPYRSDEHEWFPGKEHVDFIGLDLFNYGALAPDGRWFDFEELLVPHYRSYAKLGPPLMIAEVGTSSAGGNKRDWILGMFRTLRSEKYPRIRALVLFDQPPDAKSAARPVDWRLSEVEEIYGKLQAERTLMERFVAYRSDG
jgi:hypothetical protein